MGHQNRCISFPTAILIIDTLQNGEQPRYLIHNVISYKKVERGEFRRFLRRRRTNKTDSGIVINSISKKLIKLIAKTGQNFSEIRYLPILDCSIAEGMSANSNQIVGYLINL